MTSEYTEIEISTIGDSKKDFGQEAGTVIDEETVIEVEKDEGITQEEESFEQEKPEPKTKKVASKEKKKSRSAKRIQQLLNERNELVAELERSKKERDKVEKSYKVQTKSAKEAMKDSITSQLEGLKTRMKAAIEAGEAEDVVNIQTEMHDAQIQLAALSYELKDTPVVEDENKQKTKKVDNVSGVSPKAKDWVEEHSEFKTDPIFYGAAMAINGTLIDEGFDPNSDDFYEELNERLAPRFPEVFGIDDENMLEYDQDADETSDEDATRTKNKKSSKSQSKKSKPQQTMSGASRAANSANKRGSSGRNTVKLSPADVELAKRWGISLENFARQKYLRDITDKEVGEYTPIEIK